MKRQGLVPAIVLGLSAMASTACATGYAYGAPQYRDGRPYYDSTYFREVGRRAYDNGFHEGVEAGERDARTNHRYEPQRHSDWRHADEGYRREYGNPDLYRRSFRNGFEAGYAQAYRNSDRGYRRW